MFSIIIPLYQAEKTLSRCLDSLLPALEEHDEVLLIDDGSIDETAALCAHYAERYRSIRLLFQENRGVSAARNIGIAQAKGPFLCFVDGDDEVDTAAFASFLQQVRHGRLWQDIWFNDFKMMTPQGIVLRCSRDIPDGAPQYGKQPLLTYLSGQGTYANVWRCVFQREFLISHSLLFQEGLSCGEDLLFMTQAILAVNKVGFLHRPYYHYLVEQGESLSHNRSVKRVTDFLNAFQAAYTLSEGSKVGQLMQKKMLRELAMLLAQLPELNPAERETGVRAVVECMPYLTHSPCRIHRIVALAVRCFGVTVVAKGFCLLKGLKRRMAGLPRKMEVT